MAPRIHITGASGSGTTTLARSLAERLEIAHLDTDSFFWMPTDPPFTTQRPVPERLALMSATLTAAVRQAGVISGSWPPWGETLIQDADLVVFLYVPPDMRLERTYRREVERYGAAIEPGGPMHEAHVKFMAWCARLRPTIRSGPPADAALSLEITLRCTRCFASKYCPTV